MSEELSDLKRYSPQPDITAFELSAIMKALLIGTVGGKPGGEIEVSQPIIESLPESAQRHFTQNAKAIEAVCVECGATRSEVEDNISAFCAKTGERHILT